jgi:hypothetical protein
LRRRVPLCANMWIKHVTDGIAAAEAQADTETTLRRTPLFPAAAASRPKALGGTFSDQGSL